MKCLGIHQSKEFFGNLSVILQNQPDIYNLECRLTQKKNGQLDIKARTQAKQIQAQRFVMNNLRHGIEYLKEHCSRDKSDGKKLHTGC